LAIALVAALAIILIAFMKPIEIIFDADSATSENDVWEKVCADVNLTFNPISTVFRFSIEWLSSTASI